MMLRYSPDEDMAARTAVGEADSIGALGMFYVICTIRNRLDDPWVLETKRPYHFGTVEEIVHHPYAYSCWLPGPNRDRIVRAEATSAQAFTQALGLAIAILRAPKCPVRGITHYYNPTLVPDPPPWTKLPAESVDLSGRGPHVFYRNVY